MGEGRGILPNPLRRALLGVTRPRLPVLSHPEAWRRVAVAAVNAVLVIALARSLAVLTLTVVSGRAPSAVEMAVPVAAESAANKSAGILPPADYAAIGQWHLFGRAEASQPIETPSSVIPVTPLNLRLAGIFFIERGEDRALALIAEGGGPERRYRVGESLPGGARLERIERNRVVVSRNGRQEVLNLPKSDDTGQASVPASILPVKPEPGAGPTAPAGPQVIDASVIAARLRSEALSRPQVLEDIAFASPYVQNGQFAGFRLRPGRDRQLFQQLGLNGGDVITEINGNRLSSPAQGLTMLQELLSAPRIDVRVLRNGAEIPITFSLDGPVPNERD